LLVGGFKFEFVFHDLAYGNKEGLLFP
jgi:hypothetical protein